MLKEVLGVRLDPNVRQERSEVGVVRGQGREKTVDIGERLDQVSLRVCQNAETYGRRLTSPVASKKEPVLPADRTGANRSLREVIVDFKPPVLRVYD